MKSNRLNLCVAVRNTLRLGGYSTVKTVNAVNAALGELEVSGTKRNTKLGDGRITKTAYKVTETETIGETFSGSSATVPLRFDAWHSAIAKAEKIAAMESVTLPGIFVDWLNGFAKCESKEEANTEDTKMIASA